MNIEIFRENINLSDAEEQFIRDTISHLSKYSGEIDSEESFTRVDVIKSKIKTSNKKIVVEVTMQLPHLVIRAEENGVTLEEGLKNATDKLRRQVEKYKASLSNWDREGKWIGKSTLEEMTQKQDETVDVGRIVKRKKLEKLPLLSEAEAVTQMELSDHDFFVYRNVEDGKVHVVYKRKDSHYGLLEVSDEEAGE